MIAADQRGCTQIFYGLGGVNQITCSCPRFSAFINGQHGPFETQVCEDSEAE